LDDRLSQLLATTEDGYIDLNFETGETLLGGKLFEKLGHCPIGGTIVRLTDPLGMDGVHPDDRQRVRDEFETSIARCDSDFTLEYRLCSAGGSCHWVRARSSVLDWTAGGRPARLCTWLRDITDSRRVEDAFNAILATVAPFTGKEFFDRLVLRLAETLQTKFAVVAQLPPGRTDRVSIVAVTACGAILDNFDRDLAGTPCENAVKGNVAFYPSGVSEIFPEDQLLRNLSIEGYLGVPLRSSSGHPLGLIAVMHDAPMPENRLSEGVLQLFASRAASELERLGAEKGRAESERRHHELFERSLSAIAILESVRDEAGTLRDFRWLECNTAMQTQIGLSPQLTTWQTLLEVLPEFDRGLLDRLFTVLDTGHGFEAEIQSRVSKRYFEIRAFRTAPERVAVLLHNITERRQAQEALLESERRFRELLETIQMVALIVDNDGVVEYCNEFTAQLLGCSRGEILGRNWFEHFVPEPDRARIIALFRGPGGWNNFPRHSQNLLRTCSGRLRTIDWDTTPLYEPSGKIRGAAGIGRDLTERLAVEEELRRAQHMEAVGRLAGGVAHDFNNLLTVVGGYTRLAQAQVPSGSVVAGYLSEVAKASGRAADLTRQLLAFSRKQVMQARPVSINTIIREMEPMLAGLVGETIRLTIQAKAGQDVVIADPLLIEQVLVSLASNAREAMPRGGDLRIATSNVMLDKSGARPPDLTPGLYVEVLVSDTGSGMSADVLEHLFEPFFTTKDRSKGTGLGLSSAYGIVRQTGGDIRVESAPGQGTTFRIYFKWAEQAGPGEPESAVESRSNGFPARILIADDEESVRLLLKNVLEDAGYEVRQAADGREAMKEMQEGGIDLLITDLVMPDQEGIETIREARTRYPELRIIAISGAFFGQFLKMAEKLGADAVLQKPIRPDLLCEAVRGVLQHSREQ